MENIEKIETETKWWGWGKIDIRFPIEKYPGLVKYIDRKFSFNQFIHLSDWDLDKFRIGDNHLSSELIIYLSKQFQKGYSISKKDRILHSKGKSYSDLIQFRNYNIINIPDIIFFPETVEDIKKIYVFAKIFDFSIVPFGGGTSVVGGVESLKGNHTKLAVVNLKNFNKILKIDGISQLAEVESGILGVTLENELKKNGFTFGHFPQSFEFSTLGGWVATRSSGQNSQKYGGIENLIDSIEMISPDGEIRTFSVPRKAEGPDWNEIICGSEGTLGIITKLKIKLSPYPDLKKYMLIGVKNFQEGVEIIRISMQNQFNFAMIRLSDEEESECLLALSKSSKNKYLFNTLKSKLLQSYLKWKGLDPSSFGLLLVGFEGKKENVKFDKKIFLKLLKSKIKYVNFGEKPGQKWLKDRFFHPYLRDELLDNNFLVETLETSTNWDNLINLYTELKSSILSTNKNKTIVFAHLSHSYKTGASLYFTIITKTEKGKELVMWDRIKEEANKTIYKYGGSISHHHGIGVDHKNYKHWCQKEEEIFRSIKLSLDSKNIMNPGKLI